MYTYVRIIALLFGWSYGFAAENPASNYKIGPGDELSIRVLDSIDIPDKPIRVDPDGQIAMPLIGRIQAAGKTVAEFETDLSQKLRVYIIRPQVSVSVTDFGSEPVSVLGEVMAPGVYQLSGTKSLSQLIALAKGFAPDAGGRIRIASYGRADTRGGSSARFSYAGSNASESTDPAVIEVSVEDLLTSANGAGATLIHPYDVVTVPKARLIYVIGEVHKPGGHVLNNRESVSVLEAISMAEGPLPTASMQHARLLRRDPNTSQRAETSIDLKRILAGHGDNVILHPDDILLVPQNAVRAVAMRSVEAAISLGTGFAIWR